MSNQFGIFRRFHPGHQISQRSRSLNSGNVDTVRATGASHALRAPWWVLPTAAGTLWGYLCVLVTALAASRSAGTALFLSAHHVGSLGTLYMVVAIAVTAMLYLLARLDRTVSQERLTLATTCVVGIGALFFATWSPPAEPASSGRWLFHGALYVFVETCAVVTTLQFWTLSNRLFNWPQAHRWYPLVASGGIVGSILGGWLARQMARGNPMQLMWIVVLSCPVVFVAITLLTRLRARLYVRQAKADTSVADQTVDRAMLDSGGAVRTRWERLSANLSRVVFLTVFTTTLTDFYFKFFADQQFASDPTGLTGFFGSYYMAVGVTTLLLQIVVTPLLLRRAGAFSGLSLMPAALLVGVVANLVSPTLVFALCLKLIDSSFSHSVYRSCRELLFTPLPIELVGSFKTLAEGVAGRLGLFSCGAVVLVLSPLLRGWVVLGAIGLSAVVWLAALRNLRYAYRNELPEIWKPMQQEEVLAPLDLDRAAFGR